ncbi:site-specific integrase [bacterium]|nr:site-specific integrase [bacterium]
MGRASAVPAYCRKVDREKNYAFCTLKDSVTGRRRTYRLGEYDTPASRERYLRLLAAWERAERRLPAAESKTAVTTSPAAFTVTLLCDAYWSSIEGRYSRGEARSLAIAIRIFRQLFGTAAAAEVGPNALRVVRDAMVAGDSTANPPRAPWARGYINMQMQRIRRIFKWAVSRELLPAAVYQAIATLEPLKRGQTAARESSRVRPASEAAIAAVRPYVSRQVAAMIELQLVTGMRPGEVCVMRPADIDMSGHVWLYQPADHKTAWRDISKTVYLGPKAQKIIHPYLKRRATTAYLFSPAEADEDRRDELSHQRVTPLSCGNRPGTNRREAPTRTPGQRYTAESYCRAIARACDAADEAARAANAGAPIGATSGRLVPRWHPHQLRHNYATAVRREYGLEAAQILLGHSSAMITDAVYAERDMAKAMEIAGKIG